MVSGDRIYSTVTECFYHSNTIFFGTQWRIHSVIRITFFKLTFCQHDIMGSGLGSYFYATFFGIPYHCGRGSCTYMADMYWQIIGFCKSDFPCSACILGSRRHSLYTEHFGYPAFVYFTARKIRIFTVCSHGDTEFIGFFHCRSHKGSVFNRSAVIGEC